LIAFAKILRENEKGKLWGKQSYIKGRAYTLK
jgi:hypothetical protein